MLNQSRACFALFVLVAIVALPGAAGRRAQPVVPAANEPVLVFSLHFSEGMPVPGRDTSSGSVIAAWDDGVVVFARNPRKAGQEMLVGRLTQADLGRVITDLREAGFFESLPGGGIAPDASYYLLWASHDGKSAHYSCMWDADRFGPSSAKGNRDEHQRRFARMWALSRVALFFAYPDGGRPLEGDPEIQRRLVRSGSSYYIREHVNERRP